MDKNTAIKIWSLGYIPVDIPGKTEKNAVMIHPCEESIKKVAKAYNLQVIDTPNIWGLMYIMEDKNTEEKICKLAMLCTKDFKKLKHPDYSKISFTLAAYRWCFATNQLEDLILGEADLEKEYIERDLEISKLDIADIWKEVAL